jgi:PAS domain S-box-containing protein
LDTCIQSIAPFSIPRTPEQLLHELQAHQVELEMQNEQLRQSQLELEYSRDRYVDFYDFAPVGYLTLNPSGAITEINLTGAALLGVVRNKLLNHRFAPFVAQTDRARWDRFFLSVLNKDNKLSCELMFQHGDKSCLYAQLDCRQLQKEGHETVVRISLTDISERKLLEKAKQEMLDRFINMTRLVPGIVYQFQLRPNGSTCIPYASEAFHRIFRLNPAQVLKDASKVFSAVHPDDLESMMDSIQASARTLTPWQHEFRIRHDDQTLYWLYGNSHPQRAADGSTLWHGFMTDITERKQAELKLRDYNSEIELRNQVLKLIIQDVPLKEILDVLAREIESLHPEMRCAVMLLDDKRRHLRLCAAPGLPEVLHESMDCVISKHGNCACQEAIRSARFSIMKNLTYCKLGLQSGMQSSITQPIMDGERIAHGTFTIFFTHDKAEAAAESLSLETYANLVMLVIERDQARIVLRSQQELKTYQAAARRYASHLEIMREEEKNNFAREMHDDLGSALTAIRMEAYLLNKKLSALENPEPLIMHTDQLVKLIDDATANMRRIIIGLRPSILDDFGLQDALEWHAEQFHKRTGVECNVDCTLSGTNEHYKNHPINLFRIFQEALTNVARHAGASLVEVRYQHDNQEIMLSVTDNGCGMASNQTVNPGSFGMVGMSERTEQMGGTISFDSPPGGGFSVVVRLPAGVEASP